VKRRLKFVWTPNLPIRTKFFPKKVCLVYLKKEKEIKIRMGATRRNLQAQSKIIKFIVTPNQPIRTRIFPKKTMFRTLKV
jgi:hypothetical protein